MIANTKVTLLKHINSSFPATINYNHLLAHIHWNSQLYYNKDGQNILLKSILILVNTPQY